MSIATPAADANTAGTTVGVKKLPDWSVWPLEQSPVLTQFANDLPEIVKAAGEYDEMYGVKLVSGVEGYVS
jgi:hypothetical protein